MENTNVTEQSTNEIMPMAASGETNFASLPEKTTPASGDMFLMEDSEDTKKINYDKLADAILNKLTSKTYSGLETTAKNFVTAINELNSKSKSDTTNKSKFEVKIHDKHSESFKTLLMYGATSATGFFIYLIFIDTISGGSAVTFFKISDQISGRSFTGSYDEESKTLKINCNQTLYGGVYLVIT